MIMEHQILYWEGWERPTQQLSYNCHQKQVKLHDPGISSTIYKYKDYGEQQEELEVLKHEGRYDLVDITETWWDEIQGWSVNVESIMHWKGINQTKGEKSDILKEICEQNAHIYWHPEI